MTTVANDRFLPYGWTIRVTVHIVERSLSLSEDRVYRIWMFEGNEKF